ncbi:MAG: hypothetical protein Q9225_003151 [Loekoesia sp. 1 TL-2023]
MVISSNCLHATRSLGETLRHCRQLLRPGGRLVLLEITRDFLPTQLVMSALPGWFLGIEDGRVWAPTVSVERWDELLKTNGFSGLTTRSKAASQTQAILQAAAPFKTVIVLPGLRGIQIPKGAAVLSLGDLDSPVFRDMNQKRFRGLQDVRETVEMVLWVTSGEKVLSLDTVNRGCAARLRQVTQATSLGSKDTAVVLDERQGAFELQTVALGGAREDEMRLQVTASSLHTLIYNGYGPVYVCIDRDLVSKDKVLAFSDLNSSLIKTIYNAILPRFDRQSETDLHEMLAEAIVCGRPGSDQTAETAELITCIRTIFLGEWRDNPRLSCYSGQQQLQDDSSQEQAAGSVSVKTQFAAAEDPAECLIVPKKCFALALGNLLEIDPEQLHSNMPVVSLGIDSLVAIRMREWFLKEMSVDVPVLKFMSDSYSMSRMCDDVLVDWLRLNKT